MNPEVRLPYPGLRSFRPDEADLFFGRDACVNDMVDRLAATRFLAVLGASGSGKSSLVHTGLLDGLEFGLMATAGPRWMIADMRPAGQPITNLARALLKGRSGPEAATDATAVTDLADRLRSGPRAILQWSRDGNLPARTNLLLLVDQFEELFRYPNYAGREEAETFVALLLESSIAKDLPIYVVLTMRSEFLGPCALFPDLAERINAGLYLTRRMTRDEMRLAITGPAGVCGFAIEPALVNRLLNDLESFALSPGDAGSDQLQVLARRADQLPLMQHVLNRLWLRTPSGAQAGSVTLYLSDYDKLKGMSGALDEHAEEVLASIAAEHRAVAEPLFRALMNGTSIATAVRVGHSVGELVDIVGKENRVAAEKIIEAFRDPGCNFLAAEPDGPLTDGTMIDISHESLIRHWGRLDTWLQREAKKAADYRYLEDRARRWERGEAGLLKMPDLRAPLEWQRREHPNEAWAVRYGGDFKLAELFLNKSINRRKAWLGAMLGSAGLVAVICLVLAGFWINGFMQKREAAARSQEAGADYSRGRSFEFPTNSGLPKSSLGSTVTGNSTGGQNGSNKGEGNASIASTAVSGQPNYEQALIWYRKAAQLGSAEAEFRIGFLYQQGHGVKQDYVQAADWYLKAARQGYPTAYRFLGLLYEQGGPGVAQDYISAADNYRKAAAQGDSAAEVLLGLLYEQGRGVPQDYLQAAKWYRLAAGPPNYNSAAQNNLGVLYEYGRGVKQDSFLAASWYMKAATQGDASGQNNLGWLYEEGQGVTQDYKEAESWYLKAAAQGNIEAERHLGFIYDRGGHGVAQNYKQAATWYREAADQGDALAENNLGALCALGHGVPQNYAQAAAWYLKAANQGNALAQRNLGVLYEQGLGVKQDYVQAAAWYLRAANQEDAVAQRLLGWLNEYGKGVKQDYAQAAAWYLKAANQDDAAAQNNLGLLYEDGHGVTQDYAQAAAWYLKAAEQGDATAQDNLGRLYEQGEGVSQNYAQAAVWYGKAAEQGNKAAERNLGLLYQQGKGVTQDYAEAAVWYLKAADQGDATAQRNLALLYDQGHGIAQDYAQAAVWYRKAAEQGDATAQNNLGALYEQGQGVKQDYVQAAAWYLKAAEQGDAKAQRNIGVLYAQGKGVKQDYAQAAAWSRKAAEQGDATAQRNLGVLYEQGLGVKQDYVEAVAWYLKAANQGDAVAQRLLGWLYEYGKGVKQDYAQAAAWYLKAANQNDAAAQNNLGLLYEDGHGVAQDYAQAMNWFSKAAANGSADAAYNIGGLFDTGHGVKQDDAQAIAWFARDAAMGDPDGELRIGMIYARQGKYDDAVAAYRQAVTLAQAILSKTPGDGTATNTIRAVAGKIGDVSFEYLLQGAFQKALDAASYAVSLAPGLMWLQTNEADALMMLGRTEEARAIYLRNKEQKDDGTGRPWNADVLADFAALRQKGYSSPLMIEIEAAFRPPGNLKAPAAKSSDAAPP